MSAIRKINSEPTDLEAQRLLRRAEVERLVGLRRSALYEAMTQGDFPRPVKLGERAVAWRSADVLAWIASRQTA